jgi:hypothetical protein
LTYPTPPIYAGQDVTAVQINAMSSLVALATCTTQTNNTSEAVVAQATIPATDAGLLASGGYQLDVSGIASSTGTPTVQFRMRLGSATGTLLAASGSITTQNNASGVLWWYTGKLRIRVGATLCDTKGDLISYINSGTMLPNYGGQADVAITTTSAVTLVITTQWGTANGSVTAEAGALSRI